MNGGQTVSQNPALRSRRIGVCGGASIDERAAHFCEALGAALAQHTEAVIVSGGCKKRDGPSLSADWHIVQGVKKQLKPEEVSLRIETLLPGDDVKKIEKFSEGKTIRLTNRSPQARRFALASTVDVLVAVAGGGGTRQYLDLALALGHPILPVPFCGGKANTYWKSNSKVISEWFDIDKQTAKRWEALLQSDSVKLRQEAPEVAKKVIARLLKRCMVIMPFSKEYDHLYKEAIAPATTELGFFPIRTDRLNLPGDIIEMIYAGIRNCDCAIAVLTEFRPNVMYELGLTHAYDKPTLILVKKGDEGSLPFDIDNQNVIPYTDNYECLKKAIKMGLDAAQKTFVAGRLLAFNQRRA